MRILNGDLANMKSASNSVLGGTVCQADCVENRIPSRPSSGDLATSVVASNEANISRPGSSGANLTWRPRSNQDELEQHENTIRERQEESQRQRRPTAAGRPNTGRSSSSLFEHSPLQQAKVCRKNSSTNNNEHSKGHENVVDNQRQMQHDKARQQRRLITRGGQQSKATAVSSWSSSWLAARLVSSVQLCLVVFVLSLCSSTTTTLVNGIRLAPDGNARFYWSGEQFVISCQNNNNIKNVKIQWVGPNRKPITDNRKERVHIESNGHRLVVMNAQLDQDDGNYSCAIFEGVKNREETYFILKVLKETNFKATNKHVTLKAGQRGQLDCQVEFDPNVTAPSVAWFKNGVPVELLNDNSIKVQEYSSDRQLSTLTFNPVRRDHEDEYTCQATAVTPNLSKIIDFKIQVETQYGPVFDSPEQTVWVESIQAINSRLHHSGASQLAGGSHQHQHQQQQSPGTIPHRNMFGANNQRGRNNRLRPASQQEATQADQLAAGGATGVGHQASEQVVRVELKCTCQANPEANILWFVANSNQNFAISKGSPEQVVEEPTQTRSGHNTTSTLVVAYNLDPSWPYRREKYKCSASNMLDTAEKFFTIEQGNPPPAFKVGAHKSYSPETTVFNFTLLGPVASGPGSPLVGDQTIGNLGAIMPPVDSFRIRSESGPAAPMIAPMSPIAQHHTASSLMRRQQQSDQSVHVAYALGPETNLPLNMSVKLGNLPSGVQRLFLEAHNAVGYSPNATYLGEFNLVSSGFSCASLIKLSGLNLFVLLAGQLFVLANYYSLATNIAHS